MRRTLSVLVAFVLVLAGGAGLASAEPATPAPASEQIALITLTTIPQGWQERTDLRPVLEVFADGRAIRRGDAISADRAPGTDPRPVEGTVREEVLRRALTEIKELAAADFGTPATNDKGVQIIDLMPQAAAEVVHLIVYSPEAADGFDTAQQDARKRFADVYRALQDGFSAR